MSYFEQEIKRRESVQRQFAAFVVRLRQNFALKFIALVASILLYVFVQGERNPVLQRTLIAAVVRQDVPPDVEIDAEPQLMIGVTGPASIVQRLSDNDIRAVLSLREVARDSAKPQITRVHLEVPGLSKQAFDSLIFDPPDPTMKVQVYAPITRQLPVHPMYPKDAPAGYNYGPPDINPVSVQIFGRADRVNRVEEVIINAAPVETGARIDGPFAVLPRDKDGNPVEGVTIKPATVRISVPLVEKLPSKLVPISVMLAGLPQPPYTLGRLLPERTYIKVIGRGDILKNIYTIQTEPIPVSDFTETQEVNARLFLPDNAVLRDENDRPIIAVKVRIEIEKGVVEKPVKPVPKPPDTGKASDGLPKTKP